MKTRDQLNGARAVSGTSSARVELACGAPAENVYDLLADPASHLEWGGRRQHRMFRLVSLEGPTTPATVGAVFSSIGTIPGSLRCFDDHSTVTVATPSSVFEIVTESRARRGSKKPMEATFRHRYELRPEGGGCRLNYTLSQERLRQPMLRFRLGPMRAKAWGVGIPMMMRRGCKNLVRMAEEPGGGRG